MSANVSTTMVGDLMRVTVRGAADGREARKLAQKAAGTAAVGSAVPRGKGTHVIDVSAKALAARKVVGSLPPAKALATPDPLAAVLASLDPAVADVIRAALAAKAPKAAAAPKAPSTFVTDVIAPRAAAKAAAHCKTCADLGVVRAGGKRKGEAYSTPNGARGAVNAAKCPACKGKHTERLSA